METLSIALIMANLMTYQPIYCPNPIQLSINVEDSVQTYQPFEITNWRAFETSA